MLARSMAHLVKKNKKSLTKASDERHCNSAEKLCYHNSREASRMIIS